MEAVFIYQITHLPPEGRRDVYFLYTEEKQDPSFDLLNRLKKKDYPVKAASQATVVDGKVVDKTTKRNGAFLEIRRITCTTVDQCEVEGHVVRDNDNIEGWSYQVVNSGEQWVVKKAELILVS